MRGTHVCSRSEEHTSELQSHHDLVCRLLLEKKNTRAMVPLNALVPGKVHTTRARQVSVKARVTPYQNIPLVAATLETCDALSSAAWCDKPCLKEKICEGLELVISACVQRKGSSLQFHNPEY